MIKPVGNIAESAIAEIKRRMKATEPEPKPKSLEKIEDDAFAVRYRQAKTDIDTLSNGDDCDN